MTKTNRYYILTGLVIIISIIICGIISSFVNLKVDEFKPAFVTFLIDCSKQNTKIDVQKKFIINLCATLDPEDKIKIIQISGDTYLIYEGSPQNKSEIKKSLDIHTKNVKISNISVYDSAIKKAIQYCLSMKKNDYVPAVIVIGSLENQGQSAINWNYLPQNIKNTLKYMPNFSMTFLWVEPKMLDMVKTNLTPILGENQLVLSTELTIDKASRKILKTLGR